MAISKLPRVDSFSYINSQTAPGITWETANKPQLCVGWFEQFKSAGNLHLHLCLCPGTVYLLVKTEPIMTSWQNQDGHKKNGQRMVKEEWHMVREDRAKVLNWESSELAVL